MMAFKHLLGPKRAMTPPEHLGAGWRNNIGGRRVGGGGGGARVGAGFRGLGVRVLKNTMSEFRAQALSGSTQCLRHQNI